MELFRRSLIRAIRFALLVLLAAISSNALAQKKTVTKKKKPDAQKEAYQIPTPTQNQTQTSIHVRWPEQPGIKRYRLQVAHDEEFKDIVFDRLVFGNEYEMTGLPPGSYYWHAAPAASETGRYSRTTPLQVAENSTGGTTVNTNTNSNNNPSVVVASANSGWRTATGGIPQPLAAHLRTASGYDFVGVNSDGMVYALDGPLGFAMWTARYRPGARRGEATGNGGATPFTPIILNGKNGLANVLVAFDGGLRALEGATGSELWRAAFTSRPASGVVINSGGQSLIFVAGENSPSLTVLNAEGGKVLAQTKLDRPALGVPAPFSFKDESGVVLALEGGILDMRGSNGERLRSIKIDTDFTTAPLFINTQRGPVILVGTNSGLIALDATSLNPTGRIATEDDAPRGILTTADIDGDGSPEVVMITRKGRAVVIGTNDGKIRWYTNGALDAASATFADLNNDNVLDVLVAAGPNFALGFSGRDGSLIWRSEQEAKGNAQANASSQLRALVVAPAGNNVAAFVVGSDPARGGLRAVGLPKASVKLSQP